MTQDENSSDVSGITPDQASTPTNPPRVATKKTHSRKKPPAGKAVSVTPDAAKKPVAASAPAKKTRAGSKNATSNKTAETAEKKSPETGMAAKAVKAVPEQPVVDTPATGKTREKAPAGSASKTAAKIGRTVSPGELDATAGAGQAPEKIEPVTAKTKTPAKTATASDKPEPTSPRRTPRAKAVKSGEKTAPVAPETQTAPVPSEMQTTPAPSEMQTTPVAPETAGEAAPRPPSRRSRRGGRRRNKSRHAAEANAAAETPGADATPAAKAAPETETAKEKKSANDSNKKPSKASGKKADSDVATDEPDATVEKTAAKSFRRKMFISVLAGEAVEVVLVEEGTVVEYYVEMQHQAKVKGNIYKGVVSNIDANLQAAFVSYANGVKNGFLQIDEVHPEYYVAHHDPIKGRKYPPIQKVLRPGQEILVQVVKEPSGTKGAFLTSYLSLPGRFLVLTPGREQIGVSRKVDSDEERFRLRGLLEGLKPGKGLGVIVRTVSTGASKTSLQRDLQFLKRLWKDVRTKGQSSPTPGCIYEELDLSSRAVRDYLTDDVQEVWVDDAATAGQLKDLASLLFPRKTDLVQVHHDNGQSLFERFSLQKQLDQIHSREVSLPSGGRLVIDNTEALTAIDINSGRSSGKSNFEDMAYRTNMEAAKTIPLQLRLRDIGGQIVADFIEMRDRDHWREVEKTVRNGMKGDRARYDVGKIGPFGMLEIVRQRLGSSAISISTEPCPCCKGTGIRRNLEWKAIQSLRDISGQLRHAAANNQTAMTYHAEPELAFYLLNSKRAILQGLEQDTGVSLIVSPKAE